MDRNRWLIFAGLCIAIFVGLVMFSNKNKIDVSNIDADKIDLTSAIKDHVSGKADSKIVVVEYADYQCPGCGAAYPQVKAITEQYKDHVAFVYRNFPLTSAHPHAFAAAAAAEAAGLQGKYWEMHDLLFTNQNVWKSLTAEKRNETFEGYATQLGMSLPQFRADLTSTTVTTKINTDRALGDKKNVTSTPTLYLNGAKVSDTITSDIMQSKGDQFRAKLDALIKEAGGTPPTATSTTTQPAAETVPAADTSTVDPTTAQ